MCGLCGLAIPNMLERDLALLNLRFGGEFAGSFTNWGEGPGTGGIIVCWWDCGGGRGGSGIELGAGGLGSVLVPAWELLNIVGGRKVCMLIRDRRLVGPDEPLDLVVPVLWDDRDCINACRSASSLESAGGESSRCL